MITTAKHAPAVVRLISGEAYGDVEFDREGSIRITRNSNGLFELYCDGEWDSLTFHRLTPEMIDGLIATMTELRRDDFATAKEPKL